MSAHQTAEERITELEIRVAEQEKVIEDLSVQLAEQWKVVDASRRKLDALVKRFLSVEAAVQPEIPIDKPPHW